jgi:hypothetical protein
MPAEVNGPLSEFKKIQSDYIKDDIYEVTRIMPFILPAHWTRFCFWTKFKKLLLELNSTAQVE